jgi:hypothetical protein
MSTVTTIGGGGPSPLGSTAPAAEAEDTAADAGATPAAQQDPYVNPQMQIDPATGAVILQYRDDAGKLVRQIPSEYELRSYQLGDQAAKTGRL